MMSPVVSACGLRSGAAALALVCVLVSIPASTAAGGVAEAASCASAGAARRDAERAMADAV